MSCVAAFTNGSFATSSMLVLDVIALLPVLLLPCAASPPPPPPPTCVGCAQFKDPVCLTKNYTLFSECNCGGGGCDCLSCCTGRARNACCAIVPHASGCSSTHVEPSAPPRPKRVTAHRVPKDMAMLYTRTEGGAPPPPACPPHCVPPIPQMSSINCTFIQPSATSTAHHLQDYERTGSYLCSPITAAARTGAGAGRLLLFFTGTQPSDSTLFIQHAATLGFHAIGLSYNNEGAPNGQCSDYPKNQTIRNDHCEFDVEEERLFGDCH